MRKPLALTTAGLACLLASGCSLPSKERWAQINEHGLIPVLIDGRSSSAVASNSPGAVKPSEEHAVRVQAVSTPAIVKTPSADRVPGRAGYVFSPFTTPRKVIDVRVYQPGEAVRCPYTGQTFTVPSSQQRDVIVSRPARREERPRSTEVVSNSNSIPELDPALNRLEPTESVPSRPAPASQPSMEPAKPAVTEAAPPPPPAPVKPAPAPAATTPAPSQEQVAAAKPKGDVPYGARVAGRPGFVYSPYANKTQLVDVAGTAPGVVVKCPYTQKLFRVPEVAGEEVKPGATPSNTADAPPAPAPAPAPEPKPAVPGSLSSPQR